MVRVNRAADEDSDDVEEEEDEDSNYGGRGVSSRVSLPSKPERKYVFLFTQTVISIENLSQDESGLITKPS